MNAPPFDASSSLRLTRLAAAVALCFSLSGASSLRAQAPAAGAPAAQAPAPAVTLSAPVNVTPSATQAAPSQAASSFGGVSGTAAPSSARTAETTQGNGQIPILPPEPPSQYQILVSGSTGRILPIFGASLFDGVPTTFAPVTDVPVDGSYVIGPGDQLIIETYGQVNQRFDLTVDRTGSITIPQMGPVHVAGVPYSQLNDFLHQQLGHLYRNFSLNVNLGALRTIPVFVVGEARRPGSYSVSSLSTMLNAVFASGGPLPDGSLRDIELRREGKTVAHFDLYDLLLHGDKSNDVRLMSGDVIFIPFVGPQIAIAGSVKNPAIYELKGTTTIEQALALAGGTNAVAGDGAVRLERIFEHSMRSVEDVSLATAGGQYLQNGDILSVSSIIDRFKNAVTLRGNVASPGRYVWRPGLHLSDLIPNRASLITRNYWARQNQLGIFVQDYLPNTNTPAQGGQGALAVNGARVSRQNNQQGFTQNGNGYGQNGNDNGSQPQSQSQGQNQGQGQNQNQIQNQAQNQGSNQQGNTFPPNGMGNGTQDLSANPSTTGVEAGGNAVAGALTASSSSFSPQNDVILSAPDIDWSYAVIERLNPETLKTSLIPFNLGKLVMDGDASQNLALEPNDVVTIFSTADIRVPTSQQTRYVRLEGEFASPGVYSVQPGETLRGLLRRAGGFTSDAYLYASSFTRQSTQRVEEQRLQEFADQLEAQISSVTANNSARALSGADQTAAQVSEGEARSAVARLRRVVPSGRIVLDLHPNSDGIDALPDLALEDGDRFVVPRVPSSVEVEGQVYNANAFVYSPHSRMQDYLRRAGGPDREADRKREFILRADGSVVSRQYANVKTALVFPGDTLVVPPVIDRRAIFQRIVDVAGIVSGFGFNIATLYLLTRNY